MPNNNYCVWARAHAYVLRNCTWPGIAHIIQLTY